MIHRRKHTKAHANRGFGVVALAAILMCMTPLVATAGFIDNESNSPPTVIQSEKMVAEGFVIEKVATAIPEVTQYAIKNAANEIVASFNTYATGAGPVTIVLLGEDVTDFATHGQTFMQRNDFALHDGKIAGFYEGTKANASGFHEVIAHIGKIDANPSDVAGFHDHSAAIGIEAANDQMAMKNTGEGFAVKKKALSDGAMGMNSKNDAHGYSGHEGLLAS